MAKGRKRKDGKRTKTGRLSRAGLPSRDKGTDRTQDRQSVYGTDGSDAIGRAYRMGLLGDDADNLLIGARRIFADYWPMMGQGVERCSLGDRASGGYALDYSVEAMERQKEREGRLTSLLRRIDAMGHSTRSAFDGLVININPDYGPTWLDRIISGDATQADRAKLDMAIHALRSVCS